MTPAGRFLSQARAVLPEWGSTPLGSRLGGPLSERLQARPDPPPEYEVVDASPSFGDARRLPPGNLVQGALGLGVALAERVLQSSEDQAAYVRRLISERRPRSRHPTAPMRAPPSARCMRGRELTDDQRRLLDEHLESLGGDALRRSICCSITLEVMQDPVVAADGYTYERIAIERWVAAKLCSPMTNDPMGPELVPNIAVRTLIDATLAKVEQSPAVPKGPEGPEGFENTPTEQP